MFKRTVLGVSAVIFLLAGCQSSEGRYGKTTSETEVTASAAIPVSLTQQEGKWILLRDGEPYFIKGAGGSADFAYLAAVGGNSVRTWSTENATRVLDSAHQQGLTVMLGLSLGKERHGFDYDDADAVAQQKERIRKTVLKYKDHPALLTWGIGNEVDLFYTNTNVWYAVQDIAAMIQELDPHHLVTTVVAGINEEKAELIAERVPDIDYLSINIYGGLEDLPQTLKSIGYQDAYVVTEWGPTGHWEIQKTAWGVPIEQTSTEKAAIYQQRYQRGIAAAPNQALGSYAFLWGQKQETTPTWYGVFTDSGKPNEVVDALEYLWTGEWPSVRAPSINQFTLNDAVASDSIRVEANSTVNAHVDLDIADGQTVSFRWEILPESTDIKSGGDPESRPSAVTGRIISHDNNGKMQFAAPDDPGAYRLFVYAENQAGKVANANIPFWVNEER